MPASPRSTLLDRVLRPFAIIATGGSLGAIDTFFVRAGDPLSAVLVGLGVHQLGLGGSQLALVNMGLVVAWLAIAAGIARHHRWLSREDGAASAAGAGHARAARDVRAAPSAVPRPRPVVGRLITPLPGRS